MAYIGRGLDKISNIEHLDTITFDGSSSYSLTKNSVAFSPNSAQSILISIDGVVQSNNFTCSGNTINFGVAVPSTSNCDFIKHFGTGLAFTPADGTVTTAKLADSSVTTAKINDGAITSAKLASGVGGKVLQVVTYQDATQRSTTSTSYVDVTSFEATITPSSTSNKILVMVSSSTGNNGAAETKFNITRNGTGLSAGDGFAYAYTPAGNSYSHNHIHYLDTPSSTSALTYKLQFKVGGNTGYANHGNTQGSMTLMEIAG